MGIYIGYDYPSIIKYIEPMTGDVVTTHFGDCHFNESIFTQLSGEKEK